MRRAERPKRGGAAPWVSVRWWSALAGLALLCSGAEGRAGDAAPNADLHRPLWKDGQQAPASPRCALDRSLAGAGSTIIVLVPVGEVADGLLDSIGYALQRELSVPVCVSTQSVPLPPSTRTREEPAGEQWEADEVARSFSRVAPPRAATPASFVLVTPVDIYHGETSFLFSQTYPWGAVVSLARFGDPQQEASPVAYRAAKASLGALVKSFGVTSQDPDCVTSYSRSLAEFDAKGNRPTAESLARFRDELQRRDNAWAERAAQLPTP